MANTVSVPTTVSSGVQGFSIQARGSALPLPSNMIRAHPSMKVAQLQQLARSRHAINPHQAFSLFIPRAGVHMEEPQLLSAYLAEGQKELGPVQVIMQGPLQIVASSLEATTEPFDFSKVHPEACIQVILEAAAPKIDVTRPQPQHTKGLGQMLDGYKILDSCGVDLPEEAVRVVMTGANPPFNNCIAEHLEEFENLTYLDLSGNCMRLAKLGVLPELTELHLACNDIRLVDIPAAPPSSSLLTEGFASLQVLDLSFNFLSVPSVSELAKLPALVDLNLAGNELTELPSDMSSFKRLRKFSLRRNRLGQQYAEPPEVKQELDMDGWVKNAEPVTLDWIFLAALATMPLLEELDLSENHLQEIPLDLPLGFRHLRFLNLSYNFISHERKLLPLAEFPCLQWLDLRGNLFNVSTLNGEEGESEAVDRNAFPILVKGLIDLKKINAVIRHPSTSAVPNDNHILRPAESVGGAQGVMIGLGGALSSLSFPSGRESAAPRSRPGKRSVQDAASLRKLFDLDGGRGKSKKESQGPYSFSKVWGRDSKKKTKPQRGRSRPSYPGAEKGTAKWDLQNELFPPAPPHGLIEESKMKLRGPSVGKLAKTTVLRNRAVRKLKSELGKTIVTANVIAKGAKELFDETEAEDFDIPEEDLGLPRHSRATKNSRNRQVPLHSTLGRHLAQQQRKDKATTDNLNRTDSVYEKMERILDSIDGSGESGFYKQSLASQQIEDAHNRAHLDTIERSRRLLLANPKDIEEWTQSLNRDRHQ